MSARVLAQIEELRKDAKLSKDRHFAAAERKLAYHKICGWIVLVLEILIVVILIDVLVTHPEITWLKIIALLAAALVGSLSATQNFFDFQKVSDGHRSIANRYLEISKRCKRLLGQQDDLRMDAAVLWEELRKIDFEYDSLNREAEAFATAKSDYHRALDKSKQSLLDITQSGLPTSTDRF
jgi:hypothetical protein